MFGVGPFLLTLFVYQKILFLIKTYLTDSNPGELHRVNLPLAEHVKV